METIKLYEIVEAVRGSFGYPADTDVTQVSTDTRTIQQGAVFVCIKGERFDGHDFAAQAIEKGAVAAVAERPIDGVKCIIVDNTLKALGDIARYYRQRFGELRLVGVTGSVGKTSTKEMISLVLSEKYDTLKTQGSLNNEIGLPQTLFGLAHNTEAAVIEMGMSHSGEISRLSGIALPKLCVITNIGTAHIGNLGSKENILKAKMEILDGADYDAPLVVCSDDKLLAEVPVRPGRRKITYSLSDKNADVYASDISKDEYGSEFTVNYGGQSIRARINVGGSHNILNALCAFAVGLYYDVEPQKMAEAIAKFSTDGVRQNRVEKDGISFILDCFNASPEAMKASLEVFGDCKAQGRKIAVLADMLELGKQSKSYHKAVGEKFASVGADMLVCYGEEAAQYAAGAVKKGYPEEKCFCFAQEEQQAMKEFLKKEIKSGDLVLFKGSHGMKLDKIYGEVFG